MLRSFLASALLLGLIGCKGGTDPKGGSSTGPVKLQGSGASFPAPLYGKWFKDYKKAHPEVTVDYKSSGSGAGVKAIMDGTVDFGASDAAMTPEEIAKVDRGVVLVPMTAGKIVLAYNLEGVPDLKLTREAYTGIFLGKITKWNDPIIAKANPDAKLPDAPIHPIVRADSSGTTYVFSLHLAEISPEFKKSPGVNKAPNWPVGTKSKGNEGVTSSIQTTPGAIGYVEYGFAKNSKMPFALLENKEGAFITPSIKSGLASLESVTMPENFVAWVPDPAGKESYPIVSYTWLLLYKKYDDAAKLKAIKDMVAYGLDKGQESSESLGYIPLPKTVIEKVKPALEQLVLEKK